MKYSSERLHRELTGLRKFSISLDPYQRSLQ